MNRWPTPDWRGRRSFVEPVRWQRLPEFDVGVALLRQKRSYGWDNRWSLYFRRYNDRDVVSFPVLSQTVITASPGLTQSIVSDTTWNNADNSIEVIGGGGGSGDGASTSTSSGGGGGGGYAKIVNVTITTPGTTRYRARVGAGGLNTPVGSMVGGDSWCDITGTGSPDIFPTSGTAVGARGGRGPYASGSPDVGSLTGAFGGPGGDAANAYTIGGLSPDTTVKTSGGKGGNAGASNASGGGGGGAGGQHANGAPGGAGPGAGGRGDGAVSPDTGGGAGGAAGSPGNTGGTGTNIDGTNGSGGGGGGANAGPGTGGAGGLYGGGAGGGGRSNGSGNSGAQGIVVLTWTPVVHSGDGSSSATGAAAATGVIVKGATATATASGAASGIGSIILGATGRSAGWSEPVWDAPSSPLGSIDFREDFLRAKFISSAGYYGADADTIAWETAVIAAGGTVSRPRKELIDEFIVGLKSDGVWAKLDRIWIHAAENQPSALVDLKAGLLATAVGQISPPTTITFTTDRGFTGDGATTYVDTNFNPSVGGPYNFTAFLADFGFWNLTAGTSTQIIGGTSDAAAGCHINPLWVSGGLQFFALNSSEVSGPGGATDATGLLMGNRTTSTLCALYQNGAQNFQTTSATATLVNGTFTPLRAGTVNYSSMQCAATVVAGNLSGTDHSNLYSRMRTLMTAIGVP